MPLSGGRKGQSRGDKRGKWRTNQPAPPQPKAGGGPSFSGRPGRARREARPVALCGPSGLDPGHPEAHPWRKMHNEWAQTGREG
ncbi:hypothetical protein PtA15_6A557 [Puccinia triticina]|uniref:Uncharacterized protein n=1 Tax=Puccinia triticina TaxID=208348 RepID=A0ABY7CL26_9BASI|nr:uncharacterized protein PtA15_6A557 [Puccinia triticina]WAQ85928.1 hypothetical protein PtA15_6A557 [Puccinia triticina]